MQWIMEQSVSITAAVMILVAVEVDRYYVQVRSKALLFIAAGLTLLALNWALRAIWYQFFSAAFWASVTYENRDRVEIINDAVWLLEYALFLASIVLIAIGALKAGHVERKPSVVGLIWRLLMKIPW